MARACRYRRRHTRTGVYPRSLSEIEFPQPSIAINSPSDHQILGSKEPKTVQSDRLLGDVIVASRLHDFSVGAYIDSSLPEFTNQGGPMQKSVEDLVGLLPALARDLEGWHAMIRLPRPMVELAADNFYGSQNWQKKTNRLRNSWVIGVMTLFWRRPPLVCEFRMCCKYKRRV
jgi:hypothetical protein